MSNLVLPSFPGLTWNVSRKPLWQTAKKVSVSGREFHAAQWSYPIWQYKMSYELLRSRTALPEMQQLAGFFNLHQGDNDTWLFSDPDDNAVVAQPFGVGDGVAVSYQLVRTFGGYSEPVFEPNGTIHVFLNGTETTAFTVVAPGIVQFTTPPGSGVVLTWTGAYYWRCSFLSPQLEFNQFMRQFWELRTLEFKTWKV